MRVLRGKKVIADQWRGPTYLDQPDVQETGHWRFQYRWRCSAVGTYRYLVIDWDAYNHGPYRYAKGIVTPNNCQDHPTASVSRPTHSTRPIVIVGFYFVVVGFVFVF